MIVMFKSSRNTNQKACCCVIGKRLTDGLFTALFQLLDVFNTVGPDYKMLCTVKATDSMGDLVSMLSHSRKRPSIGSQPDSRPGTQASQQAEGAPTLLSPAAQSQAQSEPWPRPCWGLMTAYILWFLSDC